MTLVSDEIVEGILKGSTRLRRHHYPEEYEKQGEIHLHDDVYITDYTYEEEFIYTCTNPKYLELYPNRKHMYDNVFLVRKYRKVLRVMKGESVEIKLRKNARKFAPTHRMEFTPLPYSKELEYYEFCNSKFGNNFNEFYKPRRKIKFVFIE